ncbi:MAG: hypothetical protein GY729_00010 [Desulfobacteraceae bacterium]|nr:hypothetical protein [Desulfobacteraceae bacterium]
MGGQEGLKHYYLRYDVKSSKHKIANSNLVMVPAKNEFRAVKFELITLSGVIFLTPGESKNSIIQSAKEHALKTILEQKGLKSVKTKDMDTVVSYEGAIITPINIVEKKYDKREQSFYFDATFDFCPIAFPDQWESLGFQHRVKKAFQGFFSLFR